MTPPKIAALRLVPVSADQPSTLTSHIRRLERLWREAEDEREQERVLRMSCSEIETLEAAS
jgi:hypothetical protein